MGAHVVNVHNADAARRRRRRAFTMDGDRRNSGRGSIIAREHRTFVRRRTPVSNAHGVRRMSRPRGACIADAARARQRGRYARRRFAMSRFPDTNRPIDRETRPTRLRVVLPTYASHVDRSSRLLAQRVQNISATLTCAAITTAAILDSHSHDRPRIRRVRERRHAGASLARLRRHLETSHANQSCVDRSMFMTMDTMSDFDKDGWEHIQNVLSSEILMYYYEDKRNFRFVDNIAIKCIYWLRNSYTKDIHVYCI